VLAYLVRNPDNSAASGKPHFYFSLPLRRETLNFPPSRDELGVRGLGFWWTFPHNLNCQVCNPKYQISEMPIINKLIEIETEPKINIHNITPQIQDFITSTSITNGQVLVFSRHTTTALAINEHEVRLLEDIKVFLQKLAPESDCYLHNDLHLRDVPEDEPINAHSHLMAMMLTTSEIIPVVDGKLALGTWQSVLFFELDGPRKRTVFVQISGE
jgi:secondary thiamine-phosphate synthase enzyme